MTPQERELVDELFDRLSKLENAPRDPDAERLIADAGKRAPHAVYALVQTALIQDEALKRANARIEELQAQQGASEHQEQPHASFLDSMRDAITGRHEARGSVPLVRPQAAGAAAAAAPGDQSQSGYRPSGAPPQGAYAAGPAFGSGGSFLGTAASAAAGVIGGSLLLGGIRSMFGHGAGFGGQAQALGTFGNAGESASPWGGSAAADDRTRDAGLDNISNVRTGAGADQAADDSNAANAADDQGDSTDTDSSDDSDSSSDSDFDSNNDFADDSNFDDGGFDGGGSEDV